MSQSTDGQICYGVLFEDGYEFPWENNIEDWWWEEICGYKPPFDIYKNDRLIPGVTEETKRKYYDHMFEFQGNHPIPVELTNYCSDDYPMYILAVKSSILSASRGEPESFNPEELKVTQEETNTLLDFINKYVSKDEFTPKWYLSSYWG